MHSVRQYVWLGMKYGALGLAGPFAGLAIFVMLAQPSSRIGLDPGNAAFGVVALALVGFFLGTIAGPVAGIANKRVGRFASYATWIIVNVLPFAILASMLSIRTSFRPLFVVLGLGGIVSARMFTRELEAGPATVAPVEIDDGCTLA